MKILPSLTFLAFLTSCAWAAERPLALHPDNPRYLLFRGQPTVLITSGEHYGALLNLDFDFKTYLRTLAKDGLNLTRVFSGSYLEAPGAFKIQSNTLAPAPGKFLCPWLRSDQPGAGDGGMKFDLMQWDPAYFERLRALMKEASDQGVVVEMNLFCPFYEDSMWRLSPQNPANNIHAFGPAKRELAYSLDKSAGLLTVQENLTRKLVAELREFDNLYFEICNEPYVVAVPDDWQNRIADVITEAQKDAAQPHLISLNVANDKAEIKDPHPSISIFNFHYAYPPVTVGMNAHVNKVIGDNETGFKGTGDHYYRREAWAFLLAGGALYNNLDYSFTSEDEDGDFVLPSTQPGGGGPSLRRQLAYLAKFMRGLDFLRMKPSKEWVKAAEPKELRHWALAEEGKQYAVYLDGPGKAALTLAIPPGKYALRWLDPVKGTSTEKMVEATADGLVLDVPPRSPDIALSLKAVP